MFNSKLKYENEQLKQTIEHLKKHIENQPREIVSYCDYECSYEKKLLEKEYLNNYCMNMNELLNQYGVYASVKNKSEYVFPVIENIGVARMLFSFTSFINHHCKTYCLFLEKTGG